MVLQQTSIISEWKNTIKQRESWEVNFKGSYKKSCVHKGEKGLKWYSGQGEKHKHGSEKKNFRKYYVQKMNLNRVHVKEKKWKWNSTGN